MRGGEECMYSCQAFASMFPDLNQIFLCVFYRVPWVFHDLNWAETKFWAKMEEMDSDVSVKTSIFQPCSFIKLFNLLWHSQWRKERFVPICWCKLAILGANRERSRPWRNLWKGERSLLSLFFLCSGLQPHREIHHP